VFGALAVDSRTIILIGSTARWVFFDGFDAVDRASTSSADLRPIS
jgi:hypothetical protein